MKEKKRLSITQPLSLIGTMKQTKLALIFLLLAFLSVLFFEAFFPLFSWSKQNKTLFWRFFHKRVYFLFFGIWFEELTCWKREIAPYRLSSNNFADFTTLSFYPRLLGITKLEFPGIHTYWFFRHEFLFSTKGTAWKKKIVFQPGKSSI